MLKWLFGTKDEGPPIVFFVRLDNFDWAGEEGAWRCSALRIPAAQVTEIRHAGEAVSPERYHVDGHAALIFWIGNDPLPSVAVRIQVSKTLVIAADASKASVRVAQIGGVTAIMAAAITGYSGYATAAAKMHDREVATAQTSASMAALTVEAAINLKKIDDFSSKNYRVEDGKISSVDGKDVRLNYFECDTLAFRSAAVQNAISALGVDEKARITSVYVAFENINDRAKSLQHVFRADRADDYIKSVTDFQARFRRDAESIKLHPAPKSQ